MPRVPRILFFMFLRMNHFEIIKSKVDETELVNFVLGDIQEDLLTVPGIDHTSSLKLNISGIHIN